MQNSRESAGGRHWRLLDSQEGTTTMKKSLNELHKEMRAVARGERKASLLPEAPLPVQPCVPPMPLSDKDMPSLREHAFIVHKDKGALVSGVDPLSNRSLNEAAEDPYRSPTDKRDLMRQQYLVPRKSVKKLREMSRREGVSAGELVRRAIEAYTSGNVLTEPEEEVGSRAVLKDIHTQVRAALTRIDASPSEVRARERALTDGTFRAQVVAETKAWFDAHPRGGSRDRGDLRAAGDRMRI
jgi:hypothetical protein